MTVCDQSAGSISKRRPFSLLGFSQTLGRSEEINRHLRRPALLIVGATRPNNPRVILSLNVSPKAAHSRTACLFNTIPPPPSPIRAAGCYPGRPRDETATAYSKSHSIHRCSADALPSRSPSPDCNPTSRAASDRPKDSPATGKPRDATESKETRTRKHGSRDPGEDPALHATTSVGAAR